MNLPEESRLEPFILQRQEELAKAKARLSPGQLQGKIGELQMTRGFRRRLAAHRASTGKPGVIVEIKGSTPFEGKLRSGVPFIAMAEDFEAVGAVGLSVAVERHAFNGSYADLSGVQQAVRLPLLAQDLIIDHYQMLAARNAGADAVFLSVSLLGAELGEFLGRAGTIALDALVQVHTPGELDTALAAGAEFICLTNRDIHSFALERGTCEALLPQVPTDRVTVVVEGGYSTAEDLERVGQLGAAGILMGTAVMKDHDPPGVLERVLGVETPPD